MFGVGGAKSGRLQTIHFATNLGTKPTSIQEGFDGREPTQTALAAAATGSAGRGAVPVYIIRQKGETPLQSRSRVWCASSSSRP